MAALLEKSGITFRWAHEINIQPRSESRQENAARLVTEKGKSMSVFGLRHNDHVWLEVFDEKSKTWFPADPAIGVVGLKEWIAARLVFTNRRKPQVPAVAEIVEDMIVPIAVFVSETRRGKPTENRSEYYLVESFDKFYKNKLKKLPAWQQWKTLDAELQPFALAAFKSETNLHEQAELIEQLAGTYEKLKTEAASQKR